MEKAKEVAITLAVLMVGGFITSEAIQFLASIGEPQSMWLLSLIGVKL